MTSSGWRRSERPYCERGTVQARQMRLATRDIERRSDYHRRTDQGVSVGQFGKQQEPHDPCEDKATVVDWRYRHQLARGGD